MLYAEALHTTAEIVTVDAVAVADHVLGRGVLGESFNHLLGGPLRAGAVSDVEVQDAPAVVSQDKEHVQNAEGCRGYVSVRQSAPQVSAHTGTQAGQTPPDEQARNRVWCRRVDEPG